MRVSTDKARDGREPLDQIALRAARAREIDQRRVGDTLDLSLVMPNTNGSLYGRPARAGEAIAPMRTARCIARECGGADGRASMRASRACPAAAISSRARRSFSATGDRGRESFQVHSDRLVDMEWRSFGGLAASAMRTTPTPSLSRDRAATDRRGSPDATPDACGRARRRRVCLRPAAAQQLGERGRREQLFDERVGECGGQPDGDAGAVELDAG